MIPPHAYNVLKGHNSRVVKVTPPKLKLDLSFVVINIVYSFIHLVEANLC